MNIYEAIAQYLIAKGIVTSSNVFIAFTPSSPDTLLTINPTGGIVFSDQAKHNYDTPTLQLYARGKKYTDAFSIIDNAASKLKGLHGIDLSGYWIVDVNAIQSMPILVGRDAQDRVQMTQNFTLEFYNSTENRV